MSTEEQKHYESLISFFKYAISITGLFLSIIISVGIWFTYTSFTDFKQEIKDNLKETKDEIKYSLDNSKKEIAKVNDVAINTTAQVKEQANNTILDIKDKATTEALIASRQKVEETFKRNNIQDLINKTAKEEIETRVDKMVKDQIEISNTKLMEVLNVMPDFMLAVDKFRVGDTKGLVYLDSIKRFSKDPLKSRIADKIIQEKKLDYIRAYKDESKEDLFSFLGIKPDTPYIALKSILKRIILTDGDLNKVCRATVLLSKCSGQKIEIFDFDYIRRMN